MDINTIYNLGFPVIDAAGYGLLVIAILMAIGMLVMYVRPKSISCGCFVWPFVILVVVALVALTLCV